MTNQELDRLVAEKIMGWKTHHPGRPALDGSYWCVEESRTKMIADSTIHEARKRMGIMGDKPGDGFCFSPTQSINDAWQIVEKMTGQGTQRAVVNGRGKYFYWTCYWKGRRGEGKAETMPKAICLAALKAVGENV